MMPKEQMPVTKKIKNIIFATIFSFFSPFGGDRGGFIFVPSLREG
jgi:hypothetical protein